MFGRKSLRFGYVHKFLKNKLIVLPERKYYLVPLFNHIFNLITNGPSSHCVCRMDVRVELIWKRASFICSQVRLVHGWPRSSVLSWVSTQWHGGKKTICWQSHLSSACCLPSVSTHQIVPLFLLPPSPQIILFYDQINTGKCGTALEQIQTVSKRSWK